MKPVLSCIETNEDAGPSLLLFRSYEEELQR
jgi:hypothetical protein